jgi:hypothetical protein
MAELIEVTRPAFAERAERILEGISDGTLLTLKAHLLLEEAMFEAVRAKCANPEHVEKARLSFYQQLQMARALYPMPTVDEKGRIGREMLWDAAEALNTLRNQLAHKLEPRALGPVLKRLHVRELKDGESLSDPDVFGPLAITAACLIGFAWGLADSAKQPAES